MLHPTSCTFRRWAPLLVLLFGAPPLAAQTGTIAGTVRASARSELSPTPPPLAAVQVQVIGATGAVAAEGLTSESGTFRLANVPAGTYTVVFSSAGWRTLRRPDVAVAAGETVTLQVNMEQQVFDLNPITITASKKEEKALDAPAAVSVVSTRDIEEQPAITIAEHLKAVPAVDIINTGVQGNYVVVRGFNNIFSGATLTLTDNRIARVPSLRANVLHLNPTTTSDIERMEVVLGPGSALYGPNAANGVIHAITKSPIDYPGGVLSLSSGVRQQGDVPGVSVEGLGSVPGLEGTTEEIVHLEGRYALRLSDRFGAKLSGQFFQGQDFLFIDPDEAQQVLLAQECIEARFAPSVPACRNFRRGGDDTQTFFDAVTNVEGGRDPDLKRWSVDGRVDWRPSDELSVILSAGRTMANNSIDLTGLGAAQVQDWGFNYYQARALYKTAFAQLFYNNSDNTETYLLRSGRPLVDRSSLLVGQLQNSSTLGERQSFIYGVDVLRTVPQTEGTINGQNEDDDDLTEIGGYVQSETRLSEKWDFVGAVRLDHHSRLDDMVISPRAAVVFHPSQAHNFRLTYNRAFSTPSTLNMFLDISGGTVPLGGPFLYDIRAQGTGTGFTFSRTNGIPDHMSPFANLLQQSPRTFLPTTTEQLWAEMVAVVSLSNPTVGQQLDQLPVPTGDQVGIDLRTLNTATRSFDPVPGGFASVKDIPALDPTITQTFEAGYKGLLGDRLLLAANGYYSKVTDFISALTINTPNVFLNPDDVENYLLSFGLDPAQAQALAVTIGGGTNAAGTAVPGIPLGVITPEGVGGTDATIALTYRNLGDLDLYGADFSATLILSDFWELAGTAAWVSDDQFTAGAGRTDVVPEDVPLNAPTLKGTAAVRYRNEDAGLNGQVLARGVNGFPANSGVYVGEVEGYTVVDLTLGYQLPFMNGLGVTLDVQNVLGNDYTSFVGAPPLGRFSLLRLRYTF